MYLTLLVTIVLSFRVRADSFFFSFGKQAFYFVSKFSSMSIVPSFAFSSASGRSASATLPDERPLQGLSRDRTQGEPFSGPTTSFRRPAQLNASALTSGGGSWNDISEYPRGSQQTPMMGVMSNGGTNFAGIPQVVSSFSSPTTARGNASPAGLPPRPQQRVSIVSSPQRPEASGTPRRDMQFSAFALAEPPASVALSSSSSLRPLFPDSNPSTHGQTKPHAPSTDLPGAETFDPNVVSHSPGVSEENRSENLPPPQVYRTMLPDERLAREGPRISVVQPRASSSWLQNPSHWQSIVAKHDGDAHANIDDTQHSRQSHPPPDNRRASLAEEPQSGAGRQHNREAELQREVNRKNEEIMKLRASLVVALQCYAYTPNSQPGDPHAAAEERRFLSAVSNAIANPDAAPDLIVERAPPHVQGLPTVPMPLDINSIMGQFHGFLQMLETGEKTIFKKSWKTRFVVADQHGVTIFRDESDFKLHAFHKAILTIPYHNMEYFVPSFNDPCIPEMMQAAAAQDDATIAALIQMQTVAQQHARERGFGYFGFVSRQPAKSDGSGSNGNPQIVFRTNSWTEHADWAHFLGKCFNLRLYRNMFPMLLAESVFGLVCKESQTDAAEGVCATQTQTDDAAESGSGNDMFLSPPPPLPPGRPPADDCRIVADGGADLVHRFRETVETTEVGTSPEQVVLRVQSSQTEELAEWVAAVAAFPTAVVSDEAVALQRHIAALEEQCHVLRSELSASKTERDDAVDHASILQSSLGLAEREVKRLRQQIVEEHERALTMIQEARQEDDASRIQLVDQRAVADSEKAALEQEVQRLTTKVDELQNELQLTKAAGAATVKAMAEKAAKDIDALHAEFLRAEAPTSSLSRAPVASDEVQLGALGVFANSHGDIRFHLDLNENCCSIDSAHEVREELRKVWLLRSALSDGGAIELTAALQWCDDSTSDVSSEASSVGLPEAADLVDKRPAANMSHNGRQVQQETTLHMLERLQRMPANVVGRVGIAPPPPTKKKPFVPYV